MMQGTLPFQRHSATSREAADEQIPIAGGDERRVFAYLAECGERGATDEEMQRGLTMNPSTQRPRRVNLMRKQLVADSGRVRRTRSGRNAVVWVVVA
jgi:hypothetical protein